MTENPDYRLRLHHIVLDRKETFICNVATLEEAIIVGKALAAYDQHLYENSVYRDYNSMQTLEVFDPITNEWEEWQSLDGDTYKDFDLDAVGHPCLIN